MSSAVPVTNRRGVLAGGAALAALGVVASACGERDSFGGLGPTSFALSLVKNRPGRTGAWRLSWYHYEHAFFPAPLPLPVAAAARDGSPSRLSA